MSFPFFRSKPYHSGCAKGQPINVFVEGNILKVVLTALNAPLLAGQSLLGV
jgi:hypothetical protein